MNKKGITLVEFVVSVSLVSMVMVFLFNLLIDVQYTTKYGSFAKENQLNRASITRTIMDDFSNLGLIGMREGSNSTSFTELFFRFSNGSEKRLRIEGKSIIYGDEKWSMKSNNSNTSYQVRCIKYQYVSPSSSCQGGLCSDYFSVHIRIPVTITNYEENTMDDIDLFYVGRSSDITENSFPKKAYLGYNSSSCSN